MDEDVVVGAVFVGGEVGELGGWMIVGLKGVYHGDGFGFEAEGYGIDLAEDQRAPGAVAGGVGTSSALALAARANPSHKVFNNIN